MKRIKRCRSAAGAASLMFIAVSCGAVSPNPRIVEFSCNSGLTLTSFVNMGITRTGDSGKFAVYLTGPALFFGEDEAEIETLYLYLPEDGRQVDLKVDGDLLHVNGIVRTAHVDPDKPRNFTAWFKTADRDALKALRIIGSDAECAGTFETNQFQKILSANPHVFGAYVPACDTAMKETSANRKPFICWVGSAENDAPPFQQISEEEDLSETSVLMTDNMDDNSFARLIQKPMPKLHRAWLSGSKANEILSIYPHVKAVTFCNNEDDQPDLAPLTQLEELHIMGKYDDLDLGQLPNPDQLLALTALITTNTAGLEKLTGLEYLNPGEVEFSDTELSALLANFPNLVYLDLTYATLESLHPLQNAPKLEVVAVGVFKADTEPDLSPLSKLKNLRYISFHKNNATEDLIARVHKTCPQAEVFIYDHFCMGSGWLTIFIPVAAVIFLLKRPRDGHRQGA